jgi:hypothetical protein
MYIEYDLLKGTGMQKICGKKFFPTKPHVTFFYFFYSCCVVGPSPLVFGPQVGPFYQLHMIGERMEWNDISQGRPKYWNKKLP